MEQLETVEGWAIARKQENRSFTCMHCRKDVEPLPTGSCRNHCPACLWSLHLDEVPGDRASACHGPMRPIGIDYRSAKGFVVVHRCERCDVERRNKAAPDDIDALIELMARPASPGERATNCDEPKRQHSDLEIEGRS